MIVNKEFIPYEQALQLKELGFDEQCLGYYHTTLGSNDVGLVITKTPDRFYHLIRIPEDFDTLAPLYQQAFRWFREKYGYDIHIRGAIFRASYVIGIPKEINIKSVDGYPVVISWDYIVDETGKRKTYEEAELTCLKKLIEIAKNK